MTPEPSFIRYESVITPSVRVFPEKIFKTEGNVCIVDSMVVSNVYRDALAFDLYVHRGVIVRRGDPGATPPVEEKRADQVFWLCRGYPLAGYSRQEMIPEHPVYLQPGRSFADGTEWEGDIVYARSDALDHYLSCMVSYRVLSETSVEPRR